MPPTRRRPPCPRTCHPARSLPFPPPSRLRSSPAPVAAAPATRWPGTCTTRPPAPGCRPELPPPPSLPPLGQPASVDQPTSNLLGLEKFYQYTGVNTGAGSSVLNNLANGNAVWSYNEIGRAS